jgi:hypothetical protein
MKLMDEATFQFMISLKAANEFWYMSLIKCAKASSKLCAQCVKEIQTLLPHPQLKNITVNVFQICKAANEGSLELEVFQGVISNISWLHYRERISKRINLNNLV